MSNLFEAVKNNTMEHIYRIDKQSGESTHSFSISRTKAPSSRLDANAIASAIMVEDGHVLSQVSLIKGNEDYHVKTSKGDEIKLSGDITRSGLVNSLFHIAGGKASNFNVYVIVSDEISDIDIKEIDLDFQKNVCGENSTNVITPNSIFDKDCGDCGSGKFCGSWSRKCRG